VAVLAVYRERVSAVKIPANREFIRDLRKLAPMERFRLATKRLK